MTIEPGVVVKFANQVGITVNGTLDARGTDDKKIVFTSVLDNTYGGNTDSLAQDPNHPDPGDTWQVNPGAFGDASCYRAANYWGQIVFGRTSVSSVIDRAVILYGGSVRSGTWCYIPYGTGMVSIQSSSVAVTNSTVSRSLGNGIDVADASPVITGDTISGNGGRGLNYSGSTPLMAINNDWGDQSGPLDDSDDRATGGYYNPNGKGDRVSDHVVYYPWMGASIDTVLPPSSVTVVPNGNSLDVCWAASSSPSVTGYRIYYGTSQGQYNGFITLGNVTCHSLSDLTYGTNYYITISALNSVGAEGEKAIEMQGTAGATSLLTVQVNGSGSVSGQGIVCPTNCTEYFLPDAGISLTALPAPGYQFDGWSGACSGKNSCSLTMASSLSVTAVFSAARTLTVTSSNLIRGALIDVSPNDDSGHGEGSPPFTRIYNGNTTVTVTAPPLAGGHEFSHWLGCEPFGEHM